MFENPTVDLSAFCNWSVVRLSFVFTFHDEGSSIQKVRGGILLVHPLSLVNVQRHQKTKWLGLETQIPVCR